MAKRRHAESGFAVLVTHDPDGGPVPRFARIGRTALMRPRKACRWWLGAMRANGKRGRVVRVRMAEA